jgi:hypothetical protein
LFGRDGGVPLAGQRLHPVLGEPIEPWTVHDHDDAGHGAPAGRDVEVDAHTLTRTSEPEESDER